MSLNPGDRFGAWTVLEKRPGSMYLCRCDCGMEHIQYVSVLKLGRSVRCRACSLRLPRKDLTGHRVGKLTVLRYDGTRVGSRGGEAHHWWCRCDCGNELPVRMDNLSSGGREQKTCGCGRSGQNNYAWKGVGELCGEKWAQILKGARTREIPVSITQQQAWDLFQEQNGRCALTGWPLTLYAKSRSASAETDASLDRIDSDKGYELGNIQWVHKRVNQAKNDLPESDFLALCQAVTQYRGGTDDLAEAYVAAS